MKASRKARWKSYTQKVRSARSFFLQKAAEEGWQKALRIAVIRALQPSGEVPLERADRSAILTLSPAEIRAREKQQMRATALVFDASQVQSTYPNVFEWEDRILRYAFLPARKESQGLVVLFHGHNAFLHMGPMRAWEQFDVLAPWDTFGWNRNGSWFWGEKGDNFVEHLIQDLINLHRQDNQGQPWFTLGGSMGGFGALYHGIKYGCDGIYAMAPQVDLKAKVRDYGEQNTNNPYAYLQGESIETVPDLCALAEEQETLPPLFLVQHQYDSVNLFSEHGFRLLDVYNRKQAWYGVRVLPAIGHGGDGSQREAELFFAMILEKNPPRRVELSS
ncbi:MAG: alpha/beta hydrolase [Anaerolineales bacterium]|nr:alpha/beta hydrolase [Anaerolineales bacterium]